VKPAWRTSFTPAAASDHVSRRPNRGARTCVEASTAATQVPTQRLHVTSSPIACSMPPVATGSSSAPLYARPRTKGSRMKLATSLRARVRAALNVAAESTTRSSAV
jgi:hypothetical protein